MSDQKNWVTHPSKKTLTIVSLVWFLGLVLLVLGTTDLFKENLTAPIQALIISSFLAVVGMYLRYFKIKNEDLKELPDK